MQAEATETCRGDIHRPPEHPFLCGSMWIAGWLMDPAGPGSEVELRMDDYPLAAKVGIERRPDLRQSFPDLPDSADVFEFTAHLDTAGFADGEHTLACVAQRDGIETIFTRWTFRVRNGTRGYLASIYVKGTGLEIGALHSPHPMPMWGGKVTYVDRMDVEGLRKHYPEMADQGLVEVDVVDDGEKLTKFGPESQDFVIANHFLEHTQDPIGTIKRHLEVLKPGGILFMAIPDKRHTFDLPRPVTTLEHLYRDHEQGPEWSYMDHMRENVEVVGKMTGAYAEAEIKRLVDTQYSIHFHVWTHNELLEMLVDIRRKLALPFDIEAAMQNGVESLIVLKKRTEPIPQQACPPRPKLLTRLARLLK